MATEKENQVIGILTQTLQNLPEVQALPPQTKNQINRIIQQVAEQNAARIINDVEQYSNKQFEEIPNNLLGSINPLDITRGNNSAQNIANFLQPEV
jgi:hypothetical protein